MADFSPASDAAVVIHLKHQHSCGGDRVRALMPHQSLVSVIRVEFRPVRVDAERALDRRQL